MGDAAPPRLHSTHLHVVRLCVPAGGALGERLVDVFPRVLPSEHVVHLLASQGDVLRERAAQRVAVRARRRRARELEVLAAAAGSGRRGAGGAPTCEARLGRDDEQVAVVRAELQRRERHCAAPRPRRAAPRRAPARRGPRAAEPPSPRLGATPRARTFTLQAPSPPPAPPRPHTHSHRAPRPAPRRERAVASAAARSRHIFFIKTKAARFCPTRHSEARQAPTNRPYK